MSLTRQTGLLAGFDAGLNRPHSFHLSRNAVPYLAGTLDFIWIPILGALSGLAYDIGALGGSGVDIGRYFGIGFAAAIIHSAFARHFDIYRQVNIGRIGFQIRTALFIWVLTFICLCSIAFLLKIGATFSRGAVLIFFCSGIVVSAVVRGVGAIVCDALMSSRALARTSAIVIGTVKEVQSNSTLASIERDGYVVVQVFVLPNMEDDRTGLATRACLKQAISLVRHAGIDEVMIAVAWTEADTLRLIEEEMQVLPVPVKLVPDCATGRLLQRCVQERGTTAIIELQRSPLTMLQRCFKWFTDECLAAIALFLLFPMLVILAAAIRLESRGPALFMQSRAGFNGRPFRILKFRTMSTLDDGAVVVQARRGDPRITPLGRLMRKLSIDEIPQLLNVLRGEMSLVGPRPHALAHDNQYEELIAKYAIRRKMKPGITGWAQVNGLRGETPEVRMMEQRVEKDLWYIECWSPWLDMRILLLTVLSVVAGRNAY